MLSPTLLKNSVHIILNDGVENEISQGQDLVYSGIKN